MCYHPTALLVGRKPVFNLVKVLNAASHTARPLARCTQVMLRPGKMHQKYSSPERTQHGRVAIQHLSFKVHVLRWGRLNKKTQHNPDRRKVIRAMERSVREDKIK